MVCRPVLDHRAMCLARSWLRCVGEGDVRGVGKSSGWFCVTMPGRARRWATFVFPKMKYEDNSHRYP